MELVEEEDRRLARLEEEQLQLAAQMAQENQQLASVNAEKRRRSSQLQLQLELQRRRASSLVEALDDAPPTGNDALVGRLPPMLEDEESTSGSQTPSFEGTPREVSAGYGVGYGARWTGDCARRKAVFDEREEYATAEVSCLGGHGAYIDDQGMYMDKGTLPARRRALVPLAEWAEDSVEESTEEGGRASYTRPSRFGTRLYEEGEEEWEEEEEEEEAKEAEEAEEEEEEDLRRGISAESQSQSDAYAAVDAADISRRMPLPRVPAAPADPRQQLPMRARLPRASYQQQVALSSSQGPESSHGALSSCGAPSTQSLSESEGVTDLPISTDASVRSCPTSLLQTEGVMLPVPAGLPPPLPEYFEPPLLPERASVAPSARESRPAGGGRQVVAALADVTLSEVKPKSGNLATIARI